MQGLGDFSRGPVVETPRFHCRGHSLDPGWGTRIPHATQPKKTKARVGAGKGLDLLSLEVLIWGSCRYRRLDREADFLCEEGLCSKPSNNEDKYCVISLICGI